MSFAITVTGASGFVGEALASCLRRQLAASRPVTLQAVARKAVPGALRVDNYAQAPAGDVLVHLAECNDRRVVESAGVQHEQEAAATLKALLAKGFSRVVYASSAVLYGDSSDKPHSAGDAVQPTDAYTRIKRSGELAVLQQRGGVVARLVNLYGPGMPASNVLSKILGQIPGEGPLAVMDAAPVRDFLWIDDAAAALARMGLGENHGVFNIGTGNGTSVGDLARTALLVAGQPQREVVATAPSPRRSHLTVDIAPTCLAFGWQPTTTLRDGLAALLRRPARPIA